MNKAIIIFILSTLLGSVGMVNWLKGRTEVTDTILQGLAERDKKQQEEIEKNEEEIDENKDEINDNEKVDLRQSYILDDLEKRMAK